MPRSSKTGNVRKVCGCSKLITAHSAAVTRLLPAHIEQRKL